MRWLLRQGKLASFAPAVLKDSLSIVERGGDADSGDEGVGSWGQPLVDQEFTRVAVATKMADPVSCRRDSGKPRCSKALCWGSVEQSHGQCTDVDGSWEDEIAFGRGRCRDGCVRVCREVEDLLPVGSSPVALGNAQRRCNFEPAAAPCRIAVAVAEFPARCWFWD